MKHGAALFPESASSLSPQVDLLFWSLVGFSAALGLFLSGLVIAYSVKYRKAAPAERHGGRTRTLPFEIAWTSASLLIAFAIFGWGAVLFVRDVSPPDDSLVISGIGKQWMWKFRHPGGQREINALHVPVGQPVAISLASQDVIHSFFVPAFRVKQDAVPGRSTQVWFEATKTGRYHLFCAEFCGTEHSRMTGWVTVMQPEDYADWLARQSGGESMAADGRKLFNAVGCSGCHGKGARIRAPDLAGIYNRTVATMGGPVKADEAYIRDSILKPNKQVAAGYGPVMPSFDGLLTEAEIQLLVAYIRSLDPNQQVEAQ